MSAKLVAVAVGISAGFIVAWARLSDPVVIHNMLMLREPHVFFVMGSAVAVAGLGAQLLRACDARALLSNEPIAWSVERPQASHIAGSVIFGVGWSVAGTCPGPVAAMVGQGHLGGLAVMAGILAGVTLHRARSSR